MAVGAAGAALGSQRDLGHLTTEPGVPGPAAVILTNAASEAPHAVATGARLAAGLAHAGSDVVLIVDEATLGAVDSSALTDAAGVADEGAVTVIAVRALGKGAELPPRLGFDTTLVFSVEQFALRVFPAIDPTQSNSRFATSEAAERARVHLRQAAALRAWFNQPLFVGQDWINTFRSVHDPEKLASYAELAGPVMIEFGGRFVARGMPATVFESVVMERTTVIEFESVDRAVAAYGLVRSRD